MYVRYILHLRVRKFTCIYHTNNISRCISNVVIHRLDMVHMIYTMLNTKEVLYTILPAITIAT